jgi:ATP-binding cassette, subfamily B, bacterial
MEIKLPPKLSTSEALRRSLWMVVQAAPRELRNLALINLVTGFGPSISLFLGKLVIDEVSRLLAQGAVGGTVTAGFWFLVAQPKLLGAVAAAVLLGLVVDAIDSVGPTLFAALRDRVQGYAQGKVLNKVANFDDIALFEMPDLLNLLEMANKGIQRVQRLSFIVAATLVGVFIFIPSVLVSTSIGWWVPPVLMLSSIPSTVIEVKYNKKAGELKKPRLALPVKWISMPRC